MNGDCEVTPEVAAAMDGGFYCVVDISSKEARMPDGNFYGSLNELFARANRIVDESPKSGSPTHGSSKQIVRSRFDPINIDYLKAKCEYHTSLLNGLTTALREKDPHWQSEDSVALAQETRDNGLGFYDTLNELFARANQIVDESPKSGGKPTHGNPKRAIKARFDPINVNYLKTKCEYHTSFLNSLVTALREKDPHWQLDSSAPFSEVV